jgi:hypothetical protein
MAMTNNAVMLSGILVPILKKGYNCILLCFFMYDDIQVSENNIKNNPI